jgi:ribose transport system permease protein
VTSVRQRLSFAKVGAVYVWIAIIVVFGIWVPSTFLTFATVKQVLNGNAIIALLALSLLIPLSAGVFDLSIAYNATLTSVLVTKLIVSGWPLWLAIVASLLAGLLIGLGNAFVVVRMRVDSFIGTLATGSLILALVTMVTGNLVIESPKLSGAFVTIGQSSIGGFSLPVFYVLVASALIWYVLEATATGRRLYAAGFNVRTARLAGVRTDRLRFGALVSSGFFSGVAGIVLASYLDSGDPTAGTAFLLPAFAAAFLGATQIRGGRFNVPGTLIAVLLLGTGVTGLGLAAAPQWAQDMFTGVVLIAALAVTGVQRRGAARRWWRRGDRADEPQDVPLEPPPMAPQEDPLSTSGHVT